jgi:hypothetical protein
MEVPNSAFKGNVGTSWTNGAQLSLSATITSGGTGGNPGGNGIGQSWECYGWNSDGSCRFETDVSGNLGTIQANWQKSTAWASVSTDIEYSPGSTIISSLDKYAANSSGMLMGYPISTSGTCCLELVITDSKTNSVPASEALAGKQGLSEPALKRLREIERKQKAAIAARAK